MAAATVGPRLTIPFTVGAGKTVGQGNEPVVWALMNFADASTDNGNDWVDVTADLRSFSTSRGRENELTTVDAGTATVVLDNRQNNYDPNYHSYIRPNNRIRIYEQFSSLTNPVFTGYADSWTQEWPAPGMSDAISILTASDEFRNLSVGRLPTMDPPRDSYAELVGFDNPTSYWRWSDANLTTSVQDEVREMPTYHWYMRGWDSGFEWDTETIRTITVGFEGWTIVTGGFGLGNGTPIAGDMYGSFEDGSGGYLRLSNSTTDLLRADNLSSGDPMAGTAFTFETWIRKTGNPVGTTAFAVGPMSTTASVRTWSSSLATTGAVVFSINDSGGTLRSVTSAVLNSNEWYHVACELDGANLRIFINGMESTSGTSGTGSIRPTNTAGPAMEISCPAAVTFMDFDETACYVNQALPAARLLAHYVGGTQRGWDQQVSADRAESVLDAFGSTAPRFFRPGTNTMQPAFMHGQSPLEEIRKCQLVELADGIFFVAADGTLTFLDAVHRIVSPWSTTQATFGDEGTAGQLPYLDLTVDYSLAFLANEWTGTRIGRGGTSQTASDQASIDTYGPAPQSVTDLPLTANADVQEIVDVLLAKHKDPLQRVTSISLDTSDIEVCNTFFQLEIADRIRVIRTLPGPAGWFDQTLYIHKIAVEAENNQGPWRMVLGVSPL